MPTISPAEQQAVQNAMAQAEQSSPIVQDPKRRRSPQLQTKTKITTTARMTKLVTSKPTLLKLGNTVSEPWS